MIPHILIYTNWMPKDSDERTNAFMIRIRPKRKGDAGILAHGIEHVRQFYITLGLHGFLLAVSKRYKLWAEVKAYRAQLSHSSEADYARHKDLYATWLSAPEPEGYGLQDIITKEEAIVLL